MLFFKFVAREDPSFAIAQTAFPFFPTATLGVANLLLSITHSPQFGRCV